MKLEQSFEVQAPLERVWQALVNVEHVAPCLPGAQITGRNEDGTYNGTFTVKIGPTTAAYTGKLEMERIDESAHEATMQAQGSDKRGQGGAMATIFSRLEAAGESRTRVSVDTDYRITGRLARFGRGGMIEDISERLLREFAQRLQESLEGSPPAEGEPEAAPASDDAQPPASDDAQPPASDEPPPRAEDGAPSGAEGQTPPAAIAEAPPPSPAEAPSPARATPPPSEPLDAGALVGSVIVSRIKANPWPWIAGALVLWRLLRRRRRR